MPWPKFSSGFRGSCRDRIVEVFSALGLQAPAFETHNHDIEALVAEFQHEEQTYTIEIRRDNVVMYDGRYGDETVVKHLFECYLSDELQTEDSLINGFTTRLARFLSGGSWKGPDEEPPFGWIAGAVSAALRLLKRST